MSTIIICLICAALAFGVEYFGRRHMRLFKLKAGSQSGEDIASAVDQVYYGGKESDKSEAERLRTRKTKYVLWALIVFFGAALIVFVNFKDQWLGEWKSFFSSKNAEVSETVQQKSEFFNLRLYWDYEYALRYYEQKKILAKQEAETEYAKCQQALTQAQSQADKIICEEKLAKAEKKLSSTREAVEKFGDFASALKSQVGDYVLISVSFAIGFLMAFYILYRKEPTGWGIGAAVFLAFGIFWGIMFIISDCKMRDFFSVVDLTVILLMVLGCILGVKCIEYADA